MSQTILIIEDEVFHRTALQQALKKRGFDVLATGDGEEGLALARKEKPTLVTLDLLLPKLHGLEVLEALRQDSQTASVPVLILTAYDRVEYRVKAEELKATEYLVKTDWKLGDLVEKIIQIANEIVGQTAIK